MVNVEVLNNEIHSLVGFQLFFLSYCDEMKVKNGEIPHVDMIVI